MNLRRFWPRTLIAVLLIASACTLPVPPTPIPVTTAPPPTDTPTPEPPPNIAFQVHIPANTPPNSAPAVQLLDPITGQPGPPVILTEAGNGMWIGTTVAERGALVRYRYVRPLPLEVREATTAKQPAPYRVLLINSDNPILEDTVAAWLDTPFAGDVGAVSGVVRNANTGQGVMGVLVTAGGQQTLTAWDGAYTLADLPIGLQRVTVFAPDGALRPAQADALVAKDQTTALDFTTPDPNAVHVIFVVRPPADTDPQAVIRLVGNVAQMGDAFAPGPEGGTSTIAAGRAPALTPLADGTWTVTLLLYEGTPIRYRYTLGSAEWNAELDGAAQPRTRALVVPAQNSILTEAVTQWYDGAGGKIIFEVNAPADTPPGDGVSLQINGHAPVPMWPAGGFAWRWVLYNPTALPANATYRYCRNLACGVADDVLTAGNLPGRFLPPGRLTQDLKDTVSGWQWLSANAPVVTSVPPLTPTLNFAAGVDWPETWQPSQLPFALETLRALPARTGANWVTVTRRGAATRFNTSPLYADEAALAPLPADWSNLVAEAHTAGLRVALHPVTCAYTPYGACEYWNTVPAYTPAFWDAWFAAYERYLLTQADLASRSLTDMLVVGDFKLRPSFPGEPEAPADAETRWRSLISNVRAHYKGQLAFELLMGQNVWPNAPVFLDAVDVLRVFWWSTLSSTPRPLVKDVATAAGTLMDSALRPLQQRFNKPVHLSAAYYAVSGAATQCIKNAAGQCLPFTDFNPEAHVAAADALALDLYEQADIYTGLLTAIKDRPWLAGFSAYGYNPVVTLVDKSISVRGKPAEAVLKAWYPKLLGK